MKKESKRVTALTMSAMLMLNITATAVPVSAEDGLKYILMTDIPLNIPSKTNGREIRILK